jgi:predicted PurR-regulated permease PerM
MSPFCNLVERLWPNRVFSSFLGTLVIFVVVGSILYLLIWQINLFVGDISRIQEEVMALVQSIRDSITSFTGLTLEEQRDIWQKRSEDVLSMLEARLTRYLGDIVNTTASFLLVLVYVFLLLYYRSKLYDTILMYVKTERKDEAREVLAKISRVVYQYLWGRAKVMAFLGIMYYITFLIFDIPYAVLLTIFGALVTIIPYLGPFVSGLLPIIFAFIYLDNITIAIIFTLIIISIQLFESYVMEPLVIGKEVQVNPLMVIVAIVLGSLIWGLAGMILFVPLFAMIKIVASHTEKLKPLSYFIGTSRDQE